MKKKIGWYLYSLLTVAIPLFVVFGYYQYQVDCGVGRDLFCSLTVGYMSAFLLSLLWFLITGSIVHKKLVKNTSPFTNLVFLILSVGFWFLTIVSFSRFF